MSIFAVFRAENSQNAHLVGAARGAGPTPPPSDDQHDRVGTTPIFEEVASGWFRLHRRVPVHWHQLDDRSPDDREPTGTEFATSADVGWRTADAVVTATVDLAEGGLPRRTPGARLIPGNAGAEPGPPATPTPCAPGCRTTSAPRSARPHPGRTGGPARRWPGLGLIARGRRPSEERRGTPATP